ncbi:hypothetical protein LTR37_014483 [Vermiconidia calcicola]|uniref:Uncharacterized protein n=1 Tax=Vermiconidia calcicola TaxID=1690605 RepID=A0ACC3MW83_9PEZI|nr:hypothetical protein LTR37_014483 [Vermiconidia calcicola]
MKQHERTTDQDEPTVDQVEPTIDQVEPTIEQHEQIASTGGARTEGSRSLLLELPPELRNRIYELVYEDVLAYIYLSASHKLVLTSRDQEGQSIDRSQRSMLHLTCQPIREETSNYKWGRLSLNFLLTSIIGYGGDHYTVTPAFRQSYKRLSLRLAPRFHLIRHLAVEACRCFVLTGNAPMSDFREGYPWYQLRTNHFRSLLDAFDWPVHLRNVKVITLYNSRYSDWGDYERERCPHSALLVLAVLKNHFPKIEKVQFASRIPSSRKTLHLRLDGREVQSWSTDEPICLLPTEESPELWDLEQLSKSASQLEKALFEEGTLQPRESFESTSEGERLV